MSRKAMAICALVLIAFVMGQVGCKPMTYYLDQTYKVHGTVTAADTDPAVPLISAEVFVGDYQYSELTNYYGDYEIELPAGTWTIKFVKAGYEPMEAQVTVGPDNPRVQLDAAMVKITGPVLFDLTGYWDSYMTFSGETVGPRPTYILQTGSALDCSMGFTGSLNGSYFFIESINEGSYMAISGTVSESGDRLEGTVNGDPSASVWLVPSTLPYGRLDLEGTFQGVPMSVHTDYALGDAWDKNPETFHVTFIDNVVNVHLWFDYLGFIPGEPFSTYMSVKWQEEGINIIDGEELAPVQLTISYMDDNRVAASFEVSTIDMYGNPCSLTGSFDVTLLYGIDL